MESAVRRNCGARSAMEDVYKRQNTYKISAKDTYTTGATYDATTKKLKFTQKDDTKNYEVDMSGLADGNDTLVSGSNALTLNGKELSMKIKDTAGNEVTGRVDLSASAGQIDTNTTYTMSGTQNADNTTTISLKGSDCLLYTSRCV